MSHRCAGFSRSLAVVLLALVAAARTQATGVPIDGFLPLAGFSLTREFIDDFTFMPVASTTMLEEQLGAGGMPHYDLALLDTGAAVSILTDSSRAAFGIDEEFSGDGGDDGFAGTDFVTLGGATGFVNAEILDPVGLYVIGLQPPRTDGATLGLNSAAMKGQINTSMVAVPEESDLPNVLGLSYLSQYATRIRSDLPQIFTLAGQTVRTPGIEFFPRGSGGMGIVRKAGLDLLGSSPVTPQHVPSIDHFDLDQPWEDPFLPTIVSGGLFLDVVVNDDLAGDGGTLSSKFFFDTGASVTVVSVDNALALGFDVVLDQPEFTLAIVGSGGTKLDVPGFFADNFTIPAIGGSVVAQNVPIIVLDIADPSNPNNPVPGFVGTNLLGGRNLVIDPRPTSDGPPSAGLYISDPVTTNSNWASASASANWGSGGSWNNFQAPDVLTIANVRHVVGGAQAAVLSASATAWEVNVSGAAANQTMTLSVQAGATLTTFSGLNIETHGIVSLAGGSLDVQYVDIRNGGRLSGSGSVATGSGPIPGQVENASGVVAPGNGAGILNIEGRYSNGSGGILEMEIAGLAVGTQYDRLAVIGPATLAGTLRVLLPGPYVPSLGAEYTILTATDGIGGEFDVMELPSLASGKMWHVGYGGTSLVVRVTLPGDFDGDFAVDAADLAVWKTGYGTKYSGTDFLLWQRYLGQSVMIAAPVPEPRGIVLLMIAAAGGAGRARHMRRD